MKLWIQAIADHLGVSVSELARAVKRSPSTLTRYMKDETGKQGLSSSTIEAIAAYAGVEPYEMPERRRATIADVEPWEGDGDLSAEAVRALLAGPRRKEAWVLRSFVLENQGIMPGDVLVVDTAATPRPGELALATTNGYGSGNVVRIYEPPFLVAASRTSIKPLVVDGESVRVLGTVLWTLRQHPHFQA